LDQNPNEDIQQLKNPNNLYWQDLETLTPILGQKVQMVMFTQLFWKDVKSWKMKN